VEKIVHAHVHKGNMEVLIAIYHVSEECMDLVFWKIMFHTCCISKPSVMLIIHSTVQQQQQNRGKLHKHNMHITPPESHESCHNVTENSLKIDYHSS